MVTYVALLEIFIEALLAGNRWFPTIMMGATPMDDFDDVAHFRYLSKDFRGFLEFELADGCEEKPVLKLREMLEFYWLDDRKQRTYSDRRKTGSLSARFHWQRNIKGLSFFFIQCARFLYFLY